MPLPSVVTVIEFGSKFAVGINPEDWPTGVSPTGTPESVGVVGVSSDPADLVSGAGDAVGSDLP